MDLQGARLLVVDDVPTNLDVLYPTLEREGYHVLVATAGERALEIARRSQPELVLLDVVMPGMDGFEVCKRLKEGEDTRDIPVIFLTARDEAEQVLKGFAVGGVDYVFKPYRQEEVLVRIRTHLERARLARVLGEKNAALEERTCELSNAYEELQNSANELAQVNAKLQVEIAQRRSVTDERDLLVDRLSLLRERETEHWGIRGLVGQSATLQKIMDEVRLLQRADVAAVLVSGESGTGKELIARALHAGSERGEGPFVPVNCATIPKDLAESLLFGHRKGAFSGAERDQRGYFEMADGGTLFLDEVGEMSPDLQSKLLRVLEDGAVRALGDEAEKKVDVRIVAASNADLRARIAAGSFRRDLYFRLARFTVEVPPLRQRRGDVAILARHFLQILAEEMGREVPELSRGALAALEDYAFPGNVRELKNIVERALLESGGGEIGEQHLHLWATNGESAQSAEQVVADLPLDFAQAQVELAKRALKMADGNMSQAAKILGINRNKLYRVLAQEE